MKYGLLTLLLLSFQSVAIEPPWSLETLLPEPPSVSITKEGTITQVDLGNEILSETNYNDLVSRLHRATNKDTFVFLLHNAGGDVDGMHHIIGALDSTKAHTIGKVVVSSKSAAAVIACHMKELHLSPYAYLMFHDMSFNGTISEKSSAILEMLIAERKLYRESLNACVVNGILTIEETIDIVEGKDIYKFSTDIKRKDSGKSSR